jgi:hypothetical protein
MDAKHATELELLLWAVWDPIGGVPLNEYGRYVGPLWKLLADDSSVDVVAAELRRIAQERWASKRTTKQRRLDV